MWSKHLSDYLSTIDWEVDELADVVELLLAVVVLSRVDGNEDTEAVGWIESVFPLLLLVVGTK